MYRKKILHIGSYYNNIGDNVALFGLRDSLKDIPIDWYQHQFNKKLPSDINEYDYIIIGGGGLVESIESTKSISEYKIEITAEELINLKPKIIICFIGINIFPNSKRLTDKGIKNLKALIEKSVLVSFRNDGSYEIIKSYYNDDFPSKIQEAGGPVFNTNLFNSKKEKLTNGFFNLGINSNCNIENIDKIISSICNKFNFRIISHTPKDFKFKTFDKYQLINQNTFNECYSDNYNLLDCYNKFDYGICMRGHSQLITFAKNIPSLYISESEKVFIFCNKYDLLDYYIKLEKNWQETLSKKINEFKTNEEFVNNWYNIRNKHFLKIKETYENFINLVKKEISN